MLTIIDEYTRECLAIRTARRLSSKDVITTLAKLFISKGVPEHIQSDNGPEFTAKAVRGWLQRLGVDSGSNLPPIPEITCHPFRVKPATDSGN